jgi:opacity protein-like surface antigen
MLKSGLLVGAAIMALALSGHARAADMPLKAPVKAPIPVDPWSGLYIGGNAGYSWGNWDNTSTFGSNFPTGGGTFATAFTNTASPDVKGWVAGGQVGYNVLSGSWLYGVEVDAQATGQRADDAGGASLAVVLGNFRTTITSTVANEWKMPWFATIRGRLGVTYADSWLFYATGGVAVASLEYNNTFTTTATITTLGGTPVASATVSSPQSDHATRAGLAVGAGVEKAIDAHWRVKAEYLYLDFGKRTFLEGTGLDTDIRLRDNIVRLGINYRFLP